jgi:hypothetical protein
VSYGLLNLTHRQGHAQPQNLKPGQQYTVKLQLNDAGHRFAPGHRIRIALSTCYWPMVWPSPEPGVLTILSGSSSAELPVRHSRDAERAVAFEPPEATQPLTRTVHRTGEAHRRVEYDIGSGVQCVSVLRDDGRSVIEDIQVETGFRKALRYRIHPSDPTSARAEADYELVHRNGAGWDTRIKTHSALACTSSEYLLEADLEAFEGERRIFSRSWTQRIARDFT